ERATHEYVKPKYYAEHDAKMILRKECMMTPARLRELQAAHFRLRQQGIATDMAKHLQAVRKHKFRSAQIAHDSLALGHCEWPLSLTTTAVSALERKKEALQYSSTYIEPL